MRRTALVAGALLGITPLLTACGGEETPQVSVTDVIPANEDDQFEGARASVVLVPSGRLRVWLGEPVDSVERTDTRQLEELVAPDGAVLVPITWRLEGAFPDAQGFLGETPALGVDLVTAGESYRLPAPDPEATAGESFYVVVDGDGGDLDLEVEFDGVTQTVDLRDHQREAGRAGDLYRLDDERLRPEDCGSADWLRADQSGIVYVCEVSGPLLLPYADGEWADEGHSWLAVRVRTTLHQWGITDEDGGGALYYGNRTRLTAQLAGAPPVARFDGERAECPVEGSASCMAEQLFLFDVADDVPNRLEVEQQFQLALLNRWGGFSAKERISGEVGGRVTLDVPGRRAAERPERPERRERAERPE